MHNLLSSDTPASLRGFLQNTLSSLAEDWWARYVVSVLTFQQQRRVEESRIESLVGLDLAALIRVLDQNWYEISNKVSLPREARNYVKEMQTIRNRWAHRSGDALPPDDMFRDLDTLQRFLEAIHADKDLINKVREKKQTCHSAAPAANIPEETPPKPAAPETKFTVGDIVALRADPSISGAVIQVLPAKRENRYLVFHGGNTATYYASQLVIKEAPTPSQDIVSLDEFHTYLTALQLQHPGLANLYSLHAARINYIPYQFKPVMKLIRSDRPRMLIADEVGVGKTIEAGLILRELQARSDINSVLIICPKPLVTERKWQKEMKRFDERFEHLDGQTLRYCINETDLDGVWPEKFNKAILPFSLFSEEMLTGNDLNRRRRSKGLFDLEPLPHFDLVIVDEAHHLRNTGTYVHNGVKFFCDNAEAVVFLTATPIMLGSSDLFVLLNMLRADLVIDQPSFEHMAGPNPHINRAVELARGALPGWQEEARDALKLALDTPWGRSILTGNPEFQRLYDLLHENSLSHAERVAFIRDAEQLHTFSSIINRTRRRDIGNFTTRKPETVTVEFTPLQRELHDGILSIQTRILASIHGDQNLKFMMTTIRRQAASCLFGLAPFLREILTRRTDELEWEEVDEIADTFTMQSVATIADEIKNILSLSEQLDSTDPKLEALLKILRDKQQMPNNKVMLFSSFRHTLSYLLAHLQNAGLRVGLIHGGTPDEDRRELRDRFSQPKGNENALDILLSSEVGCEGLDYQFCDCMVNYDLPWNPMRVEQRIGRIDRYGQQSETVAIYNLVTPGTVDFDIYERCLWRIGVFQSALGGSEEILGRITSEIHEVADNLTLTEEERKGKLQQISDNEIRLLKEQADLEEQQAELFGLRLPAQQTEEDIERTASFWLSATALQNLVRHYLVETCGKEQEFILGEKPLKTLRLNQEARNLLLEDFRKLPRKSSPLYRDWEKWLKGNVPTLSITFDAASAAATREATFITPIHPLALQASQVNGEQQAVHTVFRVSDVNIPSGSYPFAIYKWQKYGIREDVIFQPVCDEINLNESFFALLKKAEQIDQAQVRMPERSVFNSLDAQHHALWSQERAEHQSHNRLLAQYRKESLETSHKARLSILQEQLNKATDEKIRRMRQSEIARAGADFERRMVAIHKAETRADITAQAVAFGVMVVEGGNG
jgi:ATP-dependent helicase HepA